MSEMTVVEELMAQRDAVMFGKWVQHYPVAPDQACLVIRGSIHNQTRLSLPAWTLCADALALRGIVTEWPGLWNDHGAKSVEEVLDVLDDAIRLAKELENG